MVARDPARRLRWQVAVVACLYVGYASLMLAKLALSVGAPRMVRDPALAGFDPSTFGQLVAWGSLGALVGKCVNGAVADRLGGRRTFLLVLGATVLAAVAMGGASSVTAFALLYTLAAFAKSACWPSMAVLIQNWFRPSRYGSVWGILSTSARLGTLIAMGFLGYLLDRHGWRALFYVAGGGIALNLVASWIFLKERPAHAGLLPVAALEELEEAEGEEAVEEEELPDEEPHPFDGMGLAEVLPAFARSARVWLICGSIGFLTVQVQAFTDFLPLYLQRSLDLTDGQAGMAASAFPLGCLVSVLAGGFVYDRLSRRQVRDVLTSMLVGSVLCVGALGALPGWGLGPRGALLASMALLLVYGSLLAPAYYLPMGVFAIEFGGPHCGILIGLIDAAGYLVAAAFSWVAGTVAQEHGWGAFLGLVGASAVASALLIGAFTHREMLRARAGEARTSR